MSKCNQDDCHEEVKNEQDCPCEPFLQGSMDIIIEEQLEDGSPNQNKNTRYVKICGSIEDCRVYPIIIDETTGIGTLHLEDITSVKNVLVFVDENGQQMVNGDAYEISYYLDGEKMEEDYATIIMSSQGREHHEVHIVNKRRETTSLEIFKVLRDEFSDPLELTEDMRFILHLSGMGVEETIVLDAQNDFHVCISHLHPGTYEVHEEHDCGYATCYRFDQGEECGMSGFELTGGQHELQVINQRMSQSVLSIDKYIRDNRGELIKPQDEECFEVRVIGDNFDAVYALNCENNFYLELLNLEPGFYDVSEGSSAYEVSYLVNHQQESDYAHVEVRKCEASSVMIINTPMNCCDCTSPLRICKYMRQCDGTLVRPDDDACFKVMLCGCGFYQTFNLNACNNFCVDIDNICCGEYEIREIDNECYKTSYIVNDGRERTCAYVCLHENECNCVSIINEERNKGSVSICKYIRNQRGELVKPMKGDRFVVTLRSFFFRETFILDEHNDWCMYFDRLREGSYEVRERSVVGYDTTYIVNGCKEKNRARFTVDSDCTNEIRIVNTPSKVNCGTLRIHKFIELQNGELVKPGIDENFEVAISGPCVKECFTLHSKNNWCVILEGLEQGEYTIEETCTSGYETSYLVNGCPQEQAYVELLNEDVEVTVINSRPRGGNLEINAWIRNCDDEMMKPCGNASFDIYVEFRNETRCYTLDARNRWCILLDDLCPGKYRIIQKDNYGYDVSYGINHEEMAHGVVELNGEDQSVSIINSVTNCQGMVYIEKRMINECGDRMKPCPGSEFSFLLRAPGFKKRFVLSSDNDFCVYFDDLREGSYRLEEEDCGYDVTYVINHEEAPQGNFVLGREDVSIEVLNEERPAPVLCVEKRIRKNGRLCVPDPCECYEFVLTGKGVHEVYTLDVSNDFTVCLSELCAQHYEIKELHVEGCVSYMINGTLQGDGYFLFHDENMQITIINEEGCDDRVRISKCVEEHDQQYKPYRWESFDIQITGRNYKQRFTLNCDNDWCMDIGHLAPGNYEVKELGDYENTFIINKECREDGCFFIGGGDVDIRIINHVRCSGSLHIAAYDTEDGCRDMPQSGEYSFTLATCDWKETYTLSCENDWSLCFDELPAADYTLSSCDDRVRFEVDDEICKIASFYLECETKTVALLIEPCTREHKLTIEKKMRAACGDTSAPSCDSYEIEIQSEDGKKTVCLNEENDYCVELLLPQGNVSVKECGGHDVLYQFNCGPLHDCVRFQLAMDSSLIIFNPLQEGKQVCVQAQIQNCDNESEQPKRNDSFQITLKGIDFCENITLNRRNDWSACFCDVPSGDYEISSDLAGYESVAFQMEDCRCADRITVENSDVEVQAIYHKPCSRGSLEILKYKKDSSCGCFIRPCQQETYEVRVWSTDFDETFVLDSRNSWRKRLTQLPAGDYQVAELHAEDDVTYIVNGGKEKETAQVRIDGDSSYVKVINAKRVPHLGSIELCKFIKDGCSMERPDRKESYQIVLKGPGKDMRITLNEENDFCAYIDHLAEGTYEVREEDKYGNASYIVNGGCEMDRAVIHVMQNHNRVQILNPAVIRGSILVSKFIKGADGKLQSPSGDETYRVHVSKPNYNKVITLSKENNFRELLDDLDDGWYVIDELDHDGVTYRINGGSEVDSGVVQVRGDEQDVWIINPAGVQKGSITVTKYMRIDNRFMKPQDQDVFQFHMSRPGFNQIYTLNKENEWTQVIENLDDGSYVLQEFDNPYEVSYVVNGGSETSYAVVDVAKDDNTVFMINTTTAATGSIQITKYLRNENGQLLRPNGAYTASVHVSRPGYNQVFDLNQTNNWAVSISNLEDGQYVLNEVNAPGAVSYIINGGSEVHNGVVRVEHNQNIVQMINTEMTGRGSIEVTKYIRTQDGSLQKPAGSYTARLHVSRPGFNQFYDLNSGNGWSVKITDLDDGQYVLTEVNPSGDVSYIINGGSEVVNGIVRVQQNQNTVQMINTEADEKGSIQVTKFVRDQGQLIRPTGDFTARLHVSRPGFNEYYDLTSENDWSVNIIDLEEGQYVLSEVDPEGTVSYIINGGSEVSNGIVRVEGTRNSVQMINQLTSEITLHLQKLLRGEDDQLSTPTEGEYQVRVSSSTFDQTYLLNTGNAYRETISGLEPGTYTIEELSDSDDYQTTYRINGQDELPEVVFDLQAGVTNDVDIINRSKLNDNILEVFKYVLDTSGNFIKPSKGEVFQVRIYNAAFDKTYPLDETNRWHLYTQELPAGRYQLQETSNQGYRVQYLVNSDEMQNAATFEVQPGSSNIVEVINEKEKIQDGYLEMTKRVRNQNGELVLPSADQTFVIRLYSKDGYSDTFTLNAQNRFTMQVSRLARGTYYLEETGNGAYDVTYMVNGGTETSDSSITLDSPDLQRMTIINTRTAMFYHLNSDQDLKIVIE